MIKVASIRKRSENSYQITVSQGYDTNGKKILKTKTVNLDPTITKKQAEKELQRLAFEFEKLVSTGQFLNGQITLKDFSERWFKDYVEKQLAPKTINSYRNLLDGRIIPALGHIKLDKLQPIHLIEFYNNLGEEGVIQNIRYIAKPELIKIITGSNKRKGYASFARSISVSDKTIASICKGGKTTQAIADKIAVFLDMSVKDLFSPTNNKNTLSSNTISHYHRLLSSMLTCAVQWQVIQSNPAERVKPPKVEKTAPKHYDEEDVEKMLDLLENEDIRVKAVLYLVIFAGMRLGELSGLEWKDFDLDNNIISIRRASQYVNDKSKAKDERVNSKDPKNQTSIRTIALPPIVSKVLKQYKTWQNEQRLKVGDLWQKKEKALHGSDYDNDRLFTKWDGSPIFPDTPSKWFQKFREKNNLPPLTFHQLRHTNASLLIAQGIDAPTVGKRLGHSTPATTMKIYVHALQRPDKEAAEKLQNLFTNSKKKQA